MVRTLEVNDLGNSMVTVFDPVANIWREPIKARCKVGPWRDNNRRTDLWFTYEGVKFWGWCDESRTIFRARQIKG